MREREREKKWGEKRNGKNDDMKEKERESGAAVVVAAAAPGSVTDKAPRNTPVKWGNRNERIPSACLRPKVFSS